MPTFGVEQNKGQSRELIPAGCLLWVHVHPKELINSQNTGGEMLNLELTVISGTYKDRKIFVNVANIFDVERNSEKFREMAAIHLQRVFEGCGIFQPQHPNSYQQFDGKPFQAMIDTLLNLGNNAVSAVRVRVSKGQNGYEDKNDVEFLSPNPNSNSAKDWKKLMDSGSAQEVIAEAKKSAVPPTASAPVPAAFGGSPAAQPAQPAQPGIPVAANVSTGVGPVAAGTYSSPQALASGQPPIAPGAIPTPAAAPGGIPPWVSQGNPTK